MSGFISSIRIWSISSLLFLLYFSIVVSPATGASTETTSSSSSNSAAPASNSSSSQNTPAAAPAVQTASIPGASSNSLSLPPGSQGAIGGNSGAFTYSIPIDLPPGTHNFTPQLALTYNSGAGNGFLGVGWDIPIGYIAQNTKYGVNYSCSTGSCYVFVLGGASSELVPRTDMSCPSSACYGAKIESSFIRFQLFGGGTNSAYWIATDKAGTTYKFGTTSASRQDNSGNTAQIFKWNLDTATDTHGNTITYGYTKPANSGQIYVNTIDYQSNHIQFNADTTRRPDQETVYTPYFAVTTAYRLSSLDVYSNWTGSTGSLYKRYSLGYSSSGSTGRSIISSITPYGSDGVTKLPVLNATCTPGVNDSKIRKNWVTLFR